MDRNCRCLTCGFRCAAEKPSLGITSSVPGVIIVIDGYALKRPTVGTYRSIPIDPGTHTVKVTKAGYQDTAEQRVTIKPAEAGIKRLSFTLTPVAAKGTLAVEKAPFETEVLVDEVRVGTVAAGGTFNRDVPTGEHSIELRRSGYEPRKESHTFKAGETFRMSAELSKAQGNLSLRVTPPMAKITVQRQGDSAASTLPNNQSSLQRSGEYVVTAELEGYNKRSETVTIESGKTTTVDWALAKPLPTETGSGSKNPMAKFFEDGEKWTHPEGDVWWSHEGTNYSFLRASTGTYLFDILQEKKGVLIGRKTKAVRMIDLASEGNYLQFTLDGHNLTVKSFSDGQAEGGDKKYPHEMDGQSSFHVIVELTATRSSFATARTRYFLRQSGRAPQPSSASSAEHDDTAEPLIDGRSATHAHKPSQPGRWSCSSMNSSSWPMTSERQAPLSNACNFSNLSFGKFNPFHSMSW